MQLNSSKRYDGPRRESGSSLYASDAARWEAVTRRDSAADGHFVVAVKTTGVYAHPSSHARTPSRANVLFFDTEHEAQAAGFRASRRAVASRSEAAQKRAAMVRTACRAIEAAAREALDAPRIDLSTLAAAAGVSPFHFHRLFKAEIGLTPKAYARAARAGKLRESLPAARTVTEAIFDAGFQSNSRFYEAADAMLGMTATAYRARGARHRIRFAIGQCTLGAILVAQSEKGVCGILLGDDPQALIEDIQRRFDNATLVGDDPAFNELVARVVGFVEAPMLGDHLPLDIRGTAFQERVWRALQAVPPGETVSYATLARQIGSPSATRAVAQACGANPIAVAIPCHRVIRSDGGLSGYRWGVERKRELLRREAEAHPPVRPEAAKAGG